MLYHLTYYVYRDPKILQRLRNEVKSNISIPDFDSSFNEEWARVLLNEENIEGWNFLTHCVYETLRIDPSIRTSSVHEMNESVVI